MRLSGLPGVSVERRTSVALSVSAAASDVLRRWCAVSGGGLLRLRVLPFVLQRVGHASTHTNTVHTELDAPLSRRLRACYTVTAANKAAPRIRCVSLRRCDAAGTVLRAPSREPNQFPQRSTTRHVQWCSSTHTYRNKVVSSPLPADLAVADADADADSDAGAGADDTAT